MNVTPLVDVVLVLLIIFMVVAPMLENAAQVELPSIMNIDAERKGRADPITLSITKRGEMFLEDEKLAPEVLERRLRELHEADARRRVVLRGDRGLEFGKARRLFALCQEVGFRGVSLVVAERASATTAENGR
jgi:biopolymer transport protein ExbD/biopolymer transport protein TolR